MVGKRSKQQKIVQEEKESQGRAAGYYFEVESKERACHRISENSDRMAKALNNCEKCALSFEMARIARSAQWRTAKINEAISTSKYALQDLLAYDLVLKNLRRSNTLIEKNSSCGFYGGRSYKDLLPEIAMAKNHLFKPEHRRALRHKKIMRNRQPMEYLDRTLPDSLLFTSLRRMIDKEGNSGTLPRLCSKNEKKEDESKRNTSSFFITSPSDEHYM